MKICNGKECKYYNDTNYVLAFENIVKPYCRLTKEFLVVDWNNKIVLSKNDKCISDDNTTKSCNAIRGKRLSDKELKHMQEAEITKAEMYVSDILKQLEMKE